MTTIVAPWICFFRRPRKSTSDVFVDIPSPWPVLWVSQHCDRWRLKAVPLTAWTSARQEDQGWGLRKSVKPILIVKAGTTFTRVAPVLGDFEHWTAGGMGLSLDEVLLWRADAAEPPPADGAFSGVVVTGSHAMVTDREAWSERIADWIPHLIEKRIPFLGLCYGHQLLAQAMGGEVGPHPRGKEIGTVAVRVNAAGREDVLFGGLPPEFSAHTTHAQSVLRLPPGAVLLGGNDFEPHHAFRVGDCAWGVQFHPEYDARTMVAYIEEQSRELERAGIDVAALLAAVVEAPRAADVLRRFAALTGGHSDLPADAG